ncbi:MAG: hypothetical protein U1F29_04435 [Planctomycetota bacterium]
MPPATPLRRRRHRGSALLALVACSAGCGRETTLATDDGLVRARGDRELTSNAPDGAWTFRYPNGELREEGRFEAGHRVGAWVQYAPNGQLRSRGERVYDPATNSSPRSGTWTFWHENGVVAEHGVFVGGNREGRFEFTNRDGSVDAARTGEYHAGIKLDG